MKPSKQMKPGAPRVHSATIFIVALLMIAAFGARLSALDIPVLEKTLNDFAGMMPQASAEELRRRLIDFRRRTGHNVTVITLQTLHGENIESFAREAFQALPLAEEERSKSVLLVVARHDHKVGMHVGTEVRALFPEPISTEKMHAHVSVYFDGLRPDLGVHSGVHYLFRIIKREVHVDSATDAEKLEDASISGQGAGAIFALFLAPYLAFITGGVWGLYAKNLGIQRAIRLFVGAVLGSGTGKIIAALMSLLGSYSDALWYFILAISIPLAVFGSLTEFWMAGDWIGIPRVKDAQLTRKPTEKMGI